MDKLIPYLRSAKALPSYKLLVEFEDGVSGIIDLSAWKGHGVFDYWNEEKNFSAFKITPKRKLEWNEDIDMDPDAFYLKIINKSFEDYARDKSVLRYSY